MAINPQLPLLPIAIIAIVWGLPLESIEKTKVIGKGEFGGMLKF